MTGGMAGGTTPAHHPNAFPGNTGEPMYPRPPSFPCPLPFRPAAPCHLLPTPWSHACPCPIPWSPAGPAPFSCVPCPLCSPLPLSTCPAPLPCTVLPVCPFRWLPLPCSPSRWPRRPSAAALPCSASPPSLRNSPLGCPLCSPPDLSGPPWRPDLVLLDSISNPQTVSGPGSGGCWGRRWRSTCASASLSSSPRTAALTCGGNPGGGWLNECLGCYHCRSFPTPFLPFPSLRSFACLAPDVPCLPFPSLACPSSPSGPYTAIPAPCRARCLLSSSNLALLLPPHFWEDGLHGSHRHIGRRRLPWASLHCHPPRPLPLILRHHEDVIDYRPLPPQHPHPPSQPRF